MVTTVFSNEQLVDDRFFGAKSHSLFSSSGRFCSNECGCSYLEYMMMTSCLFISVHCSSLPVVNEHRSLKDDI